MASLAFVAAGTAIGGELGSAILLIGGIAGGIIDNKFTYPALFGSQSDPPVPTFSTPQGVNDGAPAELCLGRTVRTSGTIIWASPRRVDQRSTGQVEVAQDFAIAYNTVNTNRVIAVIFNGQKVINTQPADLVQTGSISFALFPVTPHGRLLRIDLNETSTWVDVFSVGDLVTISDTPAPNNNQYTIQAKETRVNGRIVLHVFAGPGEGADAVDPSATITLGSAGRSQKLTTEPTFYPGSQTQTVDPTISAAEGATTPAFRQTAYGVFVNVDTTSFGGNVPQRVDVIMEEVADKTLDEAISDLMLLSGYSASDFDVTDLAGIVFRGIAIKGLYRLRDILPTLFVAYNINMVDTQEKLVFKRRTGTVTKTLVAADIGYHDHGTSLESNPALISDISDFDTPSEVIVHYISPFLDYQPATAPGQVIAGFAENIEDIRLNLVLTEVEADEIAQRLIWQFQNERLNITFFTSLKHLDIEAGDVITVPIETSSFVCRVERVAMGKNFTLEFKCVVEDQDTHTQTGGDDSLKSFLSTDVKPVQPIDAEILDIPAVFDKDVLDPVLYYAARTLPGESFRGVFVYVSSDGINDKLKASTANDHVIGKADTVLPTTTNFSTFDESSTVDVTIFNGSLSSVTETQVLEDRVNMFLIGTEILYAKTATSIGTNQYRLSGLLRGVRNTEDQAGTHAIDERVVLLNSVAEDDIATIPMTFSDQGRNQFFNFVGSGGAGGEGLDIETTVDLKVLKPFSPSRIIASRDASNNITFTIDRRTRAFGGEFDSGGTPLVDDVEIYDLEIGSAPIRTFSDINGPSQVYTAAEQTADGLTPGALISVVKVYQISPIYGRGKELEVNDI